MKLRYDARAIEDLREIRNYIAAHGAPAAADRVRQHLRASINRLPKTPLMGTISSIPDIRILPPTRYPYRIYYTVGDKEIVILHIRHTARRAPDDLSGS
jgi:toxin ParE1/3/4